MRKLAVVLAVMTTGAAFAARPVARWDVIPYQRISGVFKAGVVAFHEKGCKVEFSVNGKKVHTAESPILNTRTKVWEYVYPFDAKKFADGLVNLEATVIAPDEPEYKLPALPLYANAKKKQGSRKSSWVDPKNGNDFAEGTKDAPMKSIKRAVEKAGDGGTVFLMPGSYQMKMIGGGKDRKYWTIVQPAPDVKREQVKMLGGRPGTEKLHLKNVEIYSDVEAGYGAVVLGEGGDTMVWFDNCKISNKGGRHSGSVTPFGNKLRAFVTGGLTTEVANGPNAELIRNHEILEIADCALPSSDALVVNVTINGIDAGPTTADAEVFNGFAAAKAWSHDVILYNVQAVGCNSKGLSGQHIRDCAFVNVSIVATGGDLALSRFSDEMENCLFAHVTLVDQGWQWVNNRGRAYMPTDVRFYNCLLRDMNGYAIGDSSKGLLVSNCAFYGKNATLFGVDAIAVERDFADEVESNFALPEGSAAASAGRELVCVPTDANGAKYPSGSRPCGAFAK